MDNHCQPQSGDGLQVARFEASFKQQNGPRPAGIACALRLIEIEQCESIGVCECAQGTQEAMTVRICLDHCPDEPSACMAARQREIAAHCL
jgi:hypothetical protein